MPYQEVAIVSETAQKITKVAFKDGSYVSQELYSTPSMMLISIQTPTGTSGITTRPIKQRQNG